MLEFTGLTRAGEEAGGPKVNAAPEGDKMRLHPDHRDFTSIRAAGAGFGGWLLANRRPILQKMACGNRLFSISLIGQPALRPALRLRACQQKYFVPGQSHAAIPPRS